MFRTNKKRGAARFLDLLSTRLAKPGTNTLSSSQVKCIEKTAFLGISEKLELLQLSIGAKLTTELLLPDETRHTKQIYSDFLNKLPFPYFFDSVYRADKKNRKRQKISWCQVCLNPAVKLFLQKYPNELTEYEEGILYCFPLSAIQAFGGLLDRYADEKDTAFMYYLSGDSSKQFFSEEQAYYEKVWMKLKKISPKLIDEAEKLFAQEQLDHYHRRA